MSLPFGKEGYLPISGQSPQNYRNPFGITR
jgi:hypothetical protein